MPHDPDRLFDVLRAHERERADQPRRSPEERFVLGKVIGEGASGTVWRGRDTELDRVVAIKVLRETLDDQAQARFIREARVMAGLAHDNLVALHDVIEIDGRPAVVMELIEGRSLEGVTRPDDPSEMARWVRDAARGLAAAHAREIVHRDVKPANLLLSSNGKIKVADFGVALDLDATVDLTREGAMVGTPKYMAPEQVEGRRAAIGPWTDVWALGAVLYELWCGRPPFEGTAFEVQAKIVSATPTPPGSCDAGIARDLQAVVLTCLEKDPERRYPDAGALADDLTRWLDGVPVAARSVSRSRRPFTRRRVMAAGGIGVAAVTVAWLLGAFAGASDPVEARTEAEMNTVRWELEKLALVGYGEDAALYRESAAAVYDLVSPVPSSERRVEVWESLAVAAAAVGEWEEAEHAHEKVRELTAGSAGWPAGNPGLGKVMLDRSRLDWILSGRPCQPNPRARGLLSSTVSGVPNLTRALGLEAQGAFGAARSEAYRALRDSETRRGAEELWVVIACCGEGKEAREAVVKALAIRPGHPIALVLKARLLREDGDEPGALAAIAAVEEWWPRLCATHDVRQRLLLL